MWSVTQVRQSQSPKSSNMCIYMYKYLTCFFFYFCISEGFYKHFDNYMCFTHNIWLPLQILREFLDHKTRMVEKNRLAWWLIDTSITLLLLQSENVLKELVY